MPLPPQPDRSGWSARTHAYHGMISARCPSATNLRVHPEKSHPGNGRHPDDIGKARPRRELLSSRRLVNRAAALDPVLERAEIEHFHIAHVLQDLAPQRRASARGAIEDHGLVLREGLVVIRRFRIGTEFE